MGNETSTEAVVIKGDSVARKVPGSFKPIYWDAAQFMQEMDGQPIFVHGPGYAHLLTVTHPEYEKHYKNCNNGQKLSEQELEEANECFNIGRRLVEDMVRLRKLFYAMEPYTNKYTSPEHHQAYLDAIKKIRLRFIKCLDKEFENTYAYVFPNDKRHVIFLCPAYFKARKTFYDKPPTNDKGVVDSKVGTIMHEVSHFKDVLSTIDVGNDYGDYPQSSFGPGSKDSFDNKAENNANNWEYAYERGLKHEGVWTQMKTEVSWGEGWWSCCGYLEKDSVCRARLVFGTERKFLQITKDSCGHQGLYHCGDIGECLHYGLPYCKCGFNCLFKRGWTCCGLKETKSRCTKDTCAKN